MVGQRPLSVPKLGSRQDSGSHPGQLVELAQQWLVEHPGGGRSERDRWPPGPAAPGRWVGNAPCARQVAARACRVFDTGQGRKTDATDAHTIVMVALRDKGLREVSTDPELVVLRMLCDRRDELSRARAQALNRMHRLFLELLPGGAPVKKSVSQYQVLLATVRPRDLAGKTRRRMAAEELEDLHRPPGHVLYIAGIVQLRNDTAGRAYYRRKLAAGKTPMEAMRCLRRRLSDAVYRQLAADATGQEEASPEGTPGRL